MDTRDQYGNRVDAYGNPVGGGAGGTVDEFGNPVAAAGGGHHQPQVMRTAGTEHRGATKLHRSGSSSSSSSSEDDGMGGRRKKKGMKEKLKEKLPGGHKTTQGEGHTYGEQGHAATGYGGTTTAGYGGTTTVSGAHPEQQEKKGMMEKIKEKLPGHH